MKVVNTLAKPTKKPQTFSTFITSDAIKNRINTMAGSPREGAQFMSSIISAVTNNPALQGCSHMSILNCALLGLSHKLSPSPQFGQYYMVPFESKEQGILAQFILGYKGYVQLAARSGQYRKLNALPIKAGELIRYDPLEENIEVRFIEDDTQREATETIGYYAFFEYLNGFRKTLYWSRKKMESHAKRYSFNYVSDLKNNKKNSFWSKDFDAMACKTMLRQLISKWGVISIDFQAAMEADTKAIGNDGSFVDTDISVQPETPVQSPAEPQDNIPEAPDIAASETSAVTDFFED